jgi:uncharacterized integral membrane protein
MKNIALLLIALLLATWIGAIALLAVQNAESIQLQFLTFKSIELPFGLVLAFSAALGVVGSAIILPLLGLTGGRPADPEEDI